MKDLVLVKEDTLRCVQDGRVAKGMGQDLVVLCMQVDGCMD